MSTRNRLLWTAFCLPTLLFVAGLVAQAQEMPAQPGTNMAAMKFVNIPPLPTCTRAFNIHYVNKQGNEMAPADALKAVRGKTGYRDEVTKQGLGDRSWERRD